MEILTDSHSHSTQSPDGHNSPQEMAERAVLLGIKHYTLTDHIEIEKYYDEEYKKPVSESQGILRDLKEKYSGKLDILYGAELGQPLRDKTLSESILSRFDFDFVLGSLHCCREYSFFGVEDETLIPKILSSYYEELIEMAQWGKFDVLSHITFPLRFLTGESGHNVDMSAFEPAIKKLLKTAVKNDIGIEINTSGLRKGLGETMPGGKYIKMYHDLGGKILTIGSDAHCADDLGKGINESVQMAKDIGFNEICYFEKRKPKFIKIH